MFFYDSNRLLQMLIVIYNFPVWKSLLLVRYNLYMSKINGTSWK